MREELIIAAFKKALQSRSAKQGMIAHADRSGPYAGNRFRKLITNKKLQQSISRADNPHDNAFMESCFSRFKTELLQSRTFQNRKNAQTEIFELIEMQGYIKRWHVAFKYEIPINDENNYYFYNN